MKKPHSISVGHPQNRLRARAAHELETPFGGI
jgi:hypothetical protein